MASQRITFSPQFETLIAQAGLSKNKLAEKVGVTRQVIFRGLNPSLGGTLRDTSAGSIARVYAECTGVDHDTAFALLFTVEDQPGQDATAHAALDEAPRQTLEVQRHVAKRSVPPTTEAQREGRAKGQMQTISIRLDDESLNMLAALMQDEERSSQSEMIRVLMKRAYRALVAQRSVREDTLPEVPNTDQNEEPARQRHVAHNLP